MTLKYSGAQSEGQSCEDGRQKDDPKTLSVPPTKEPKAHIPGRAALPFAGHLVTSRHVTTDAVSPGCS